jgi:hypothetical protein
MLADRRTFSPLFIENNKTSLRLPLGGFNLNLITTSALSRLIYKNTDFNNLYISFGRNAERRSFCCRTILR